MLYIFLAIVALYFLWRAKRWLFRKNLKGERVLITGGASGIGRRVAHILADMGAKIIIWDINQEALAKVEKELKDKNAEVYTYVVDLSKKDNIYQVAEKVKADHKKVDILINNAGIVSGKTFLNVSDEAAQRTVDVNTTAHFWTTKSFLPAMISENHGHLVTIASMAGHVATPGLADYCASKFGAVGFDEAIRVELKKQKITGVHTTCICPFYINTGMFDGVKDVIPFILPVLQELDVANTIVNAIRMNEEVVMLPGLMSLLPLIRILPVPLQDSLLSLMGVHNTMDEFKGRAAQPKKTN